MFHMQVTRRGILLTLCSVFACGVIGWFGVHWYRAGLEPRQCDGVDAEQTTVLVATAMEIERRAVVDAVGGMELCTVGADTYDVQRFPDRDLRIVVYVSGAGTQAARRYAERAIAAFSPEIILVSGVAGSLSASTTVGAVVVPSRWIDLQSSTSVPVDSLLLSEARFLPPIHVVDAGITLDRFLSDSTALRERASVVDMESAIIANIAAERHIPFLSVRGVSDHADGSDTDETYNLAARESAAATIALIRTYFHVSIP